ncbi:MAG: glycosyltransferase, partial [Flavobacteriaceae bacterium]|nr:glycosyltransferase [Bacteroidia bacterium]NNF73672.1 glycosyltransferase [Flavobacteriaceae bacterium]
ILEEVDLESAGFTGNKILQRTYNLIGKLLTRLILKTDLLAVTMHKYVRVLKENYGASNIKMIPHGTFELSGKPDYSLPEGPKKIMTFGKFGTYKKVEAMIEAVELVRSRTGIDLEIEIAGTDNPNVPGYLDSVKAKYAHVPNLNFTGYVEEEDVPELFSSSAVVVFPYTSTTGSSGVLHQAGSYGKAVVMPDLGDLSLLVKDEGYIGEFFDPKSVDSMSEAIQRIVQDDAYRIEMGKANYKAAMAYPMELVTDMYLEAFKALKIKNKIHSIELRPTD